MAIRRADCRRTTVLLIGSWHEWGGGETYVVGLAKGLPERGVRLVVAGRHRTHARPDRRGCCAAWHREKGEAGN